MSLFSWSIYLIWDKASLNRRTQPLGTNWESISLPRGPFTSVVAANQARTQQLIHTGGLHGTAYYICGKDKDGQALDCLKEIIACIYHSQTLKRPRNLKKATITNICKWFLILFHIDSSLSGEQTEQRILAQKLNQPTAGCITIFHKYSSYT